ncbi:MAG TPA: hypothetical protein VMS00_15670 [Acidimicrobiales bacterium]|nr:hypothetical protein [Acidimicrobiales bacterium]
MPVEGADLATFTNPAKPLLTLVRVLAGSNGGLPANKIWAGALRVGETAGPLFSGLGKVSKLLDNVEGAVRALPDVNHRLYLGWLPDLRALMAQTNLDVRWDSLQRHLRAEVVRGVEFCEDLLARRAAESAIPEGDLESLRADLFQLIAEVDEVEIDEDLRAYARAQLSALLAAIDDYALLGNQPLQQAFDQVLGTTLLLPEETRKRGAENETIKKTWRLLERVGLLLNIGQASLTSAATVYMLTTGSTPHR